MNTNVKHGHGPTPKPGVGRKCLVLRFVESEEAPIKQTIAAPTPSTLSADDVDMTWTGEIFQTQMNCVGPRLKVLKTTGDGLCSGHAVFGAPTGERRARGRARPAQSDQSLTSSASDRELALSALKTSAEKADAVKKGYRK